MRRKITLSRGDTIGGTVPLILPGRLDVAPGRSRFGRPRRSSRGLGWWFIFGISALATLVLAASYASVIYTMIFS